MALNFFPFSFSLYPQIFSFILSLCILCFLPDFLVSVSSDFFLYSFSLYPHISFRFLSHCIIRFIPIFFFSISSFLPVFFNLTRLPLSSPFFPLLRRLGPKPSLRPFKNSNQIFNDVLIHLIHLQEQDGREMLSSRLINLPFLSPSHWLVGGEYDVAREVLQPHWDRIKVK